MGIIGLVVAPEGEAVEVARNLIGQVPFTAIVERDSETNLYVAYVPGFPGAHSQGETLDELQENLREVIEMLLKLNIGLKVKEMKCSNRNQVT